MHTASDLLADGKLLADRIAAAQATGIAADLSAATGAHLAALAIIAGERDSQDCVPALLTMLDRDGVAGKAIAWALGRLGTTKNQVEAQVLAALASGGLDVRENAYAVLAALAARGVASTGLGDAMVSRVQAEIERAKSGGSGLGEHACRVLAVLGDSRTADLIQQVIEQDRFSDRFELQRLRKAVQEGGRDQESIKSIKGPWQTTFADAVFVPKPAEPAPAPTAEKVAPKPAPNTPKTATQSTAETQMSEADGNGSADDLAPNEGDDEGMPGDPQPIDWKTFATSPECEALAAPLRQLASQLGPLLEQLSVRAIRAPLGDLSEQEFAGLLLQVLPQALPPQHVQMALSPHAMQCYKAIVKFLMRTGVVTKSDELLKGIALVRKELTNQIRQAGILNGPDYSDPDDKPVAPAKT